MYTVSGGGDSFHWQAKGDMAGLCVCRLESETRGMFGTKPDGERQLGERRTEQNLETSMLNTDDVHILCKQTNSN